MLRITLWVFFGFILIAVFLPFLASVSALGGSFLFGWLSFLRRVGPEVTVNWNGIGMVILCSILIVAGLHSLSGWLFGAVTCKTNICPGLRWRWSWTLAIYAAIWLLFAAIMGAVGAAHQVGWLVRSGEPILKPRRHLGILRLPLRETAKDLFSCAEESGWNLDKTRQAFVERSGWTSSGRDVIEEFHVVMVEGTNGSLAAGFIFHRDPETRTKAGFVTVSADTPPGEIQPSEKLSDALVQYQLKAGSRPKP